MADAQKRKPDQRRCARLLAQGVSYSEAMIQSGYSVNTAKRGKDGVPDVVWRMVPAKAKRLLELGKLDTETYKRLTLGRLADNVIQGKDGGVMSAKALGSTRELDLFRTESQVGVIVVNAPNSAEMGKLLESLETPEE